jgi:mono/diheme cytochrome c family protein
MKKIMKWTGIILGGLIALLALTGVVLYPIGMEKLTQTYPNIAVETAHIPTDSDAVARGRHISIVWACTKCHGEGLSGMLLADDPILGTIPASSLTSGKEGIAKSYTNTDWIRAIHHGVKPNGRVEIFMYDSYSTMSDQDLGDLITYLKQVPPVDSDYPAMRFGSLFPIAPAVGLFTPAAELIDYDAPHAANPAPRATIEYGRYLSAICSECHSSDLASKLEQWKQDDFIRALQTGVLPNGKHLGPAMPLKTYGEMNDTELTALWLYLQSLLPVK